MTLHTKIDHTTTTLPTTAPDPKESPTSSELHQSQIVKELSDLTIESCDTEKERQQINEQIEEKLGSSNMLVEPDEEVKWAKVNNFR